MHIIDFIRLLNLTLSGFLAGVILYMAWHVYISTKADGYKSVTGANARGTIAALMAMSSASVYIGVSQYLKIGDEPTIGMPFAVLTIVFLSYFVINAWRSYR